MNQHDDYYTRHAQTKWHLQTGGKSGRQSLWALSATASEILNKRAVPPYDSSVPMRPISSKSITMDGKALGSDGIVWRMYADNTDHDVTPNVGGKDFYTFTPGKAKYHPYIGLATRTVNANLDTDTPEVCVGQTVTLGADWQVNGGLGGTPPYTSIDNIGWHLPDKYVNEQYPYSSVCTSYRKNDNLLNTTAVQCWYVNKPGGACSVRETLHFANGQIVNIAAAGNFMVYRPSVNPPVNHGPFGAGIGLGLLAFELDLMNGPMNFDVTINSKYSGNFGLTQLVNFNALPPGLYHSTYGSFWLDGKEYYDGPVEIGQPCSINDEPGVPLIIPPIGSYNGNWQTYVRFTPDGGIAVTLNRIDWNWAATAGYLWNGDWIITSDHVDDPKTYYDDSFPLWSNVKPAPEDQ
jgi:hypothetical protein